MAGKSEHVAGILEAANFYARLGLEEDTAEPAAVRSAYRSLALKVHPDKCGDPGATEAFKLLSEAFECLYDSEQQNAYLTNLQVPKDPPPKQWGKGKKRGREEKPKKRRQTWWEGKPWEEVERELRRREEAEREMREGFVARQKARFVDRRVGADAYRCQLVCEEMDRRKGVTESPLWVRRAAQKPALHLVEPEGAAGALAGGEGAAEQDGEEEEEMDKGALLEAVLGHLRSEHRYCFYCGTCFDDEGDMQANCPGVYEEDH